MNNVIIDAIYNIRKNFQHYINEKFKDIQLTSSEFIFIQTLFKEKALTQQEISFKLNCDKSHTFRIISKLLDKNMVYYDQSNKDAKRKRKIFLTNDGNKIAIEFVEAVKNWKDKLIKNININDLCTATNVLQEIAENSFDLKEE